MDSLFVCDRLLPPTDWTVPPLSVSPDDEDAPRYAPPVLNAEGEETPAYWDEEPLSTCYGDREENSDAPFRNPDTLARCLADLPTDTVTCPEGTTACASIVISVWAPNSDGNPPATWIDSPLYTTVLPSPDPCVANATLDGRCPASLFLGESPPLDLAVDPVDLSTLGFFGAQLDDERVTSSLFANVYSGRRCHGEGFYCPGPEYFISAGAACCVNADGAPAMPACNASMTGPGPERECQTGCRASLGFLAVVLVLVPLFFFARLFWFVRARRRQADKTTSVVDVHIDPASVARDAKDRVRRARRAGEGGGEAQDGSSALSSSEDDAPSPAPAPTPPRIFGFAGQAASRDAQGTAPSGSTGGPITTKKKRTFLF